MLAGRLFHNLAPVIQKALTMSSMMIDDKRGLTRMSIVRVTVSSQTAIWYEGAGPPSTLRV